MSPALQKPLPALEKPLSGLNAPYTLAPLSNEASPTSNQLFHRTNGGVQQLLHSTEGTSVVLLLLRRIA